MTVEDHLHVGLDEDGEPVRLFHELADARRAVDSDDYVDEEIVDYWPDVPLEEPSDVEEPEARTDGGLDAETARKSTAPGDVLVTLANTVVRVVETTDNAAGGIAYGREDHGRELQWFSWDSIAEYHHRDDIDVEAFLEDLYPDEEDVTSEHASEAAYVYQDDPEQQDLKESLDEDGADQEDVDDEEDVDAGEGNDPGKPPVEDAGEGGDES